MIKLIFLTIFLLAGPYTLKAAEMPGHDQDFMKVLDEIKDPFVDGLPKPVVVVPVVAPVVVKPIVKPKGKPVVVPVSLPQLHLQGVVVNEDIHEAIIDDEVVSLHGKIKEAQVVWVTKQGVELFYKGKKFFLKLD
jgi:hypothetical protein